MSRHGTLLPIPEGSALAESLEALAERWPMYVEVFPYPRSAWLSLYESILRDAYPQSSSADRKLTARHYAPFPLALGPDVP